MEIEEILKLLEENDETKLMAHVLDISIENAALEFRALRKWQIDRYGELCFRSESHGKEGSLKGYISFIPATIDDYRNVASEEISAKNLSEEEMANKLEVFGRRNRSMESHAETWKNEGNQLDESWKIYNRSTELSKALVIAEGGQDEDIVMYLHLIQNRPLPFAAAQKRLEQIDVNAIRKQYLLDQRKQEISSAIYDRELLDYPPIGWGTSMELKERIKHWRSRPANDRLSDKRGRIENRMQNARIEVLEISI